MNVTKTKALITKARYMYVVVGVVTDTHANDDIILSSSVAHKVSY